jgi:16S rRNA processing protein RimM
MIDLSDCLVLGTIAKVHGIKGQLMLRLNNFNFDDIIKMETVFIEIDGLPVPFFISEYSEKNKDTIILTFEDPLNEKRTLELIGCRVFINANNLTIAGSKPLDQIEIVLGYDVFDSKHVRLGIIEEIINVQQNPLFRIMNGKKEYLIPIQPEFIIKIDTPKKQIILNPPSGLIDLF